jgi:hypothetical protein
MWLLVNACSADDATAANVLKKLGARVEVDGKRSGNPVVTWRHGFLIAAHATLNPSVARGTGERHRAAVMEGVSGLRQIPVRRGPFPQKWLSLTLSGRLTNRDQGAEKEACSVMSKPVGTLRHKRFAFWCTALPGDV